MNYRKVGYRGYFGVDFYNPEHTKKLQQANVFIDLWNKKINTFETEEENNAFVKEINKAIDEILK